MRKNNCLSNGAFRLLLLLPAILPVACTDSGDETPFPEGKYPVEFTSQMCGMKVNTRATTDNHWTGGEQVAVEWGNEYRTKDYTAAADGSLTCATVPFYWTKDSETVTACYQQGKSFTSMPVNFRLASDQSTLNAYNQSDFIMACQTVRFADKEKKLNFRHLGAKVIVNLKGDDTVGDVSTAKVTFISLTNTGSLNSLQPSADGSGIRVIPVRLGAYSNDVTPYTYFPSASGFQKSVQALLVPHYADGVTGFIQIALKNNNGGTDRYTYTPSPTDCNLQSGKQYTYNITVSSKGITADLADVKLIESDEWSDVGSEDINSTPG